MAWSVGLVGWSVCGQVCANTVWLDWHCGVVGVVGVVGVIRLAWLVGLVGLVGWLGQVAGWLVG